MALVRKEKNCVLHELGNKMQWGGVGGGLSGCIVSPSMGSVGEQGTKPLKNIKYLAWN